ncbi:winged helix-turn-helix domain-containing protein [Victivallis sp. Marseille-Q1083]|uniref:winged helix-turn-helix domain-containing protein n=1 Tax=Victivallis sp. Marseille-Q1083 TaxID=2717288 RepID=UPI001589D37E|nr:winged helix-turn-helix domain-containing protein [Victivallis sp. Marseille-Q1083]
MTSDKNSVPSFDQMIKPTLEALKELGGVAKNDSIDQKVIEIMNLPEDIVTIPHKNGNCAEVSYRIGWARTYLKKYGLLSNPSRGRWELTEQFDDNIEYDEIPEILNSLATS